MEKQSLPVAEMVHFLEGLVAKANTAVGHHLGCMGLIFSTLLAVLKGVHDFAPLPRCSLGEVGDEQHLVFMCPAQAFLEAYLLTLMASPWSSKITLVQLLWQDDFVPAAQFFMDCFNFLRTASPPFSQP
jgi:hypothetical protein